MVDVRAASPADALGKAHARSLYAEPGTISESSITARQTIKTETAVAAFSILTGIGSAISNLVAAGRLGGVEAGSIHVSEMTMPVAVIVAGAIAGAFLMPGSFAGINPAAAIGASGHLDRVGARRFRGKKDKDEDEWSYDRMEDAAEKEMDEDHSKWGHCGLCGSGAEPTPRTRSRRRRF